MNIYYATAVNKLKVANAPKLDYANSLEGNGIFDRYIFKTLELYAIL